MPKTLIKSTVSLLLDNKRLMLTFIGELGGIFSQVDGTVWMAYCESCRVKLLADLSKLQLYFNNGKKGEVDRNLFGTNCYCSGLISIGQQFEMTIE